MVHVEYYEGILQLRNAGKDVVEFVRKQIDKKPNVGISKSVRVKNGIDIYITSRRFLVALGKKLQKPFKGEMKISGKLHTRDRISGKMVYRINVLFRLSDFKRGDIVTYRGRKLKITGLRNKVSCKDLDTGKSMTLSYESLLK